MVSPFVILAFILGVVIGSVVTIISIALLRSNSLSSEEPTTTLVVDEQPVKRKPGRPKKVKI